MSEQTPRVNALLARHLAENQARRGPVTMADALLQVRELIALAKELERSHDVARKEWDDKTRRVWRADTEALYVTGDGCTWLYEDGQWKLWDK